MREISSRDKSGRNAALIDVSLLHHPACMCVCVCAHSGMRMRVLLFEHLCPSSPASLDSPDNCRADARIPTATTLYLLLVGNDLGAGSKLVEIFRAHKFPRSSKWLLSNIFFETKKEGEWCGGLPDPMYDSVFFEEYMKSVAHTLRSSSRATTTPRRALVISVGETGILAAWDTGDLLHTK